MLQRTMKQTSILLTMAITAMLMLTGCSKDSESSNMSMEEKQLAEIRQHIVGTWEHDGDFLCNDISELSGSINGNIISGCTSEFISLNPATLVFGSDGRFELTSEVPDKEYKGSYNINTGKPLIWLTYDEDGIELRRQIPYFYYYDIYFEADYNTVYLVARDVWTVVSRYRRR